MTLDRIMGIVRLGLGFLVAPAIVPAFMAGTFVVATQRAEVDCPALGPRFLCGIVALSYACAVIFGFPWVLWMRRRGELSLSIIMAPILGLALPLLALLSAVGAMVSWSVGGIAALFMAGVILAALCFYVVAVWRPARASLS